MRKCAVLFQHIISLLSLFIFLSQKYLFTILIATLLEICEVHVLRRSETHWWSLWSFKDCMNILPTRFFSCDRVMFMRNCSDQIKSMENACNISGVLFNVLENELMLWDVAKICLSCFSNFFLYIIGRNFGCYWVTWRDVVFLRLILSQVGILSILTVNSVDILVQLV